MKSRIRTAAVILAASVSLTQVGCRNTSDETPTPAMPSPTATAEPWFCEMNAAGNDWDCVRDAALARHPAPRRLPPPRPPEPAPVETGAALAPADRALAPPPMPPPPRVPPAAAAGAPAATATKPVPTVPPTASLRDLPRDLFTVQLVAMKDREELEAFVRDSGIPELSGARVENDGEIFYALLLGIFPDRAAAERAAAARPAALQGYEPWIRPLGSLQDAMLRADQLAGTSSY